MRKKALIAAAIVLLGLSAWAQETGGDRPAYARLSVADGRIFLQRAADLGYEEATVNTPISEGDRLGTSEGRAEISFGGIRYARLDLNTKIDVQTLPRDGSALIRLRHWAGNLYLDLGSLDREKSFELLTPKATFYFLDKGLYRVDIADDGRTEILVFEGLVETAAEEGSVLVKKGQELSLTDGRFDGRPKDFFAGSADAFDRWNDDRVALVRGSGNEGRLPGDIVEYESELDRYGDWAEVEPFGFVWIPGGMAPGWRPYSWGHWTWLPFSGWCWVPYEPWGWCTFHYGRWHWSPGFGWFWIPMSGWGPAWVSWWWNDYYYGWAPMSYWGYPGFIYDDYYYGRGWDNDYPIDGRVLTVVRKDQLQEPNVGSVALRGDELRGLGRVQLERTSPTVRPVPGAGLRVEPLDGRGGVILRKDGAPAQTMEGRPESPRLIRPADRPRTAGPENGAGAPPAGPVPGRVVERPRTGTDTPPASPEERRIRKTGEGDSLGITAFPSSPRITREGAVKSGSLSGFLRDKFYRIFQGDRESGSISRGSSSSSSGSSSGSRSVRSSSSSSSSRSSGSRTSSSRSPSSGKSSSGSGTIKKK